MGVGLIESGLQGDFPFKVTNCDLEEWSEGGRNLRPRHSQLEVTICDFKFGRSVSCRRSRLGNDSSALCSARK